MPVPTFGPAGPNRSTELAVLGPVIDIEICGANTVGAGIMARGLIDTGASGICLDEKIATRLGLIKIDEKELRVVGGGAFMSAVYMGLIRVPLLEFSEIMPVCAVPMRNDSHEVLLGRSFLKNFIVTFNGPEGMFHFSHPPRPPGIYDDFD